MDFNASAYHAHGPTANRGVYTVLLLTVAEQLSYQHDHDTNSVLPEVSGQKHCRHQLQHWNDNDHTHGVCCSYDSHSASGV